MNRLKIALATITTLLCMSACQEKAVQQEPEFWLGADISWATEMEANGHKFYNYEGEERECTALMNELGLNAVRLRVWVDPSAHGN